jgi:hypothetical protein
MFEISRRSIVTCASVKASLAATGLAATATMADTRARTTYSYRQPGVSLQRARKRIRWGERVSSVRWPPAGARRRRPRGDDGELELRFGQAGGRHLFFQLGTRKLVQFALQWLGGGLRERTK